MRYVLLDRITVLEPPEVARGVKCVTLAEDVFVDHFPGHPVMPGALLLESMAQLAGVLLEQTMRKRGRGDLHALLTMVDRARFRRMVRPGDRVEVEATMVTATEDGGRARGRASVDGVLVAEAELSFAFAVVTNPVVLARRREVLRVWTHGSTESLGEGGEGPATESLGEEREGPANQGGADGRPGEGGPVEDGR